MQLTQTMYMPQQLEQTSSHHRVLAGNLRSGDSGSEYDLINLNSEAAGVKGTVS